MTMLTAQQQAAADTQLLLGITPAMSLVPMAPLPRVLIAGDIPCVVGYEVQGFVRGVIEHPAPLLLPISLTCAKGANRKRYWDYLPQSGDAGSYPLMLEVTDLLNVNLSSTTANVVVSNPAHQPASMTNILCVGDSLTNAGIWPGEFSRLLTGGASTGLPTGLSYGNCNFIGNLSLNSGGVPEYGVDNPPFFVGYPGWSWSNFMSPGTAPMNSPFSNAAGTAISFSYWCSKTLPDTGAPISAGGINIAYIELGWSAINAPNQQNFSTELAAAAAFLTQLHSDYPACQIRLLGLQAPDPRGLSYTYGANALSDYYGLLRSANNYNQALLSMVSTLPFHSLIRYLPTGFFVDTEYNYPNTVLPVNVYNSATEVIGGYSTGPCGIHPATAGYRQIGAMCFADFVRTYCV